MRWILAPLLALLLSPAVASADTYGDRLASEVARTNVWVNTASYTPPVYDEWSTSCQQKVTLKDWAWSQTIQNRWLSVPLPCYFQASPGTDREAVLRWHGSGGYDLYEFWGMAWDWPVQWHAKWGGAADTGEITTTPEGDRVWPLGMGTQASGLAFIPGLLMVSELQAGRIDHVVHVAVPEACGYHVTPAVRHDGSGDMASNPRCLPEGVLLKLDPTYVIPSTAPKLFLLLADAAQRHGFRVTDQTHDTVAFRGENWHRPYAPWGSSNPYTPAAFDGKTCDQAGGFKGCPDKNNLMRSFPWARLYRADSL